MRKIGFLLVIFSVMCALMGCGGSQKGFYVIKSENNKNDMIPYVCTYQNKFDKKTRTLTFTQIDEDGNPMGYGEATYDENGLRLTYTLKDGNHNTYLSQEFTYDEEGRETGIYTRMLGNPDCMEYKTYEDGVLVGGMLCYYDESGNISSTELYELKKYKDGVVISYYDTNGELIAASGYRDTFDKNGNLSLSITYTDGSFQSESGRVSYTYEWIALS